MAGPARRGAGGRVRRPPASALAAPVEGPVADPSSGGGGGLAEKLDHLFRAVAAPDRTERREYTYREAAEAIRRVTGAAESPVSPTYLWELRTGRRDNPTLRHLAGLAALFGVPPGYFFDDALSRQLAEEMDLLLALREPGVRDLARRAAGLSHAALDALAGMADHARRLEGLPPVPPRAPAAGGAGGAAVEGGQASGGGVSSGPAGRAPRRGRAHTRGAPTA
jgi:transcriptional regulator with XRE-family HTH domain